MHMTDDMKALIAALEAQGFTVTTTKSGRHMVRKGGEFVAVLAGNPREFRGWRNARAALRRHGFEDR